MDRSFEKFVGLPIFDDVFRDRVSQLNLDRVEFWLAMGDESSESADSALSAILPALTKDQNAIDDMLNRLDLAVILADLVKRSEYRVQREIAADLGYGSAEQFRSGVKRDATVLEGPAQAHPPQFNMPRGQGPQAQISSLQSQEESERQKWGIRLQQICARAGNSAKVNDPTKYQGMSAQDAARLKSMVFEGGGHRTIRQHVRAWEKFEEWCVSKQLSPYPPTTMQVMRYALALKDSGCGPAVIPSFKHSVGWICKRLVMTPPNLADPHLKSLSDKVYAERGKELKEATAVPMKLVMALEVYLEDLSRSNKTSSTIFIWWVLILIYSSLRFDDGVHVSPTSLEMSEHALLGLVWQTKVERKRKGTRFAVPMCSLSDLNWLDIGWKAFQPFKEDRDFFLWDLKSDREFAEAPITYSRSMAWLKHHMLQALLCARKNELIALNEVDELQSSISEITWHSMRVTFLSEAVKNNVDDKAVGLQANWKDPSQLVLKYARQRKEISVAMVKGVAAKVKEAWTPPTSSFVVEEDEDSAMQEPLKIEYILKASLPAKALSSADFRCRILDPAADSDGSICGRLKMAEAVSVGHTAPGMICQHCSAKIKE